jgi:hypothetical protein
MSRMGPFKTDTDEFQQIQSIVSTEVAKNCLKMAMLSVWTWPVLPSCFKCVWDERNVQLCPATHQMSRMGPFKTDTDEFQQMQSIGSMEEAKNCLKMAMLSVWAWPVLLGCFGCVWDERSVQPCPATHHMSRMGPFKTDTDEFQQIQSIGSMKEAKN